MADLLHPSLFHPVEDDQEGWLPGRARRLVELDHAEQVRQVGQRQRRHAISRCGRHRIVNAHNAVHNGILTVYA